MGEIKTPFKNFFFSLKQQFAKWKEYWSAKPPISYEVQLSQEVQRNAQEVLAELKEIKEDLRHSIDGKLFTYVEDVVDPIAARIQSVTQKLPHVEQADALDQWLNKKVKPLMELLASPGEDKQAISNAVMKHIIEANAKQIETDLRVLNDDKEHKLLHLSKDQIPFYEQQIDEALSDLTHRWKNLEHPPANLTLERLNKWKSMVDAKRNTYFHQAIELIDQIIPEPTTDNEMVHEELLQKFKLMEEVEQELPEIIEEIRHLEMTQFSYNLRKRLETLEQKVFALEGDLHLTPELENRLHATRRQLEHALDALNKETITDS